MLRKSFPRLWFPPLTYYKESGEPDFDRMDEMLRKVHPFCQGALVPSSTGDGWVLPEAEQEAVVRHFLKGFPFGRFSLFLGALKPDAEATKAAVRRWCGLLREVSGADSDEDALVSLGVAGFVICIPHGMQGPAQQRAALADVLDLGLPTAFYQLPQVTGALVDPEIIAELAAEYPNLIVCKDSGGGDELAASRLLSQKLTLLRGAEGDPTAMVRGEAPIYDGLLLSTVNCFPKEYADLLSGPGEFGGFGEVIGEVFAAAAEAPISNAFSDANRAMDHVLYWGADAMERPMPVCFGGKRLPKELVQKAYDAMRVRGLVPGTGYGKK